jgi:hypothetical protein
VLEGAERLLAGVRKWLGQLLHLAPPKPTELVRAASLGALTGVVGAAALVLRPEERPSS